MPHVTPVTIPLSAEEPALPGRLYAPATPAAPTILFVFAHGAGAGQNSPFMIRYAELLARHGLTVVTFDFPYLAAGRKLPDRAPALERAFLAVLAHAADVTGSSTQAIVVGGKSMGGRMATHLAAQPERWRGDPPLVGAVAFGYPLKPPGPRGGDRVSHLHRLGVPTLIVQGTRDSFGGPDDVAAATTGANHLSVLPVTDGDHSLAVRVSSGRRQREVDEDIAARVAAWATSYRFSRSAV